MTDLSTQTPAEIDTEIARLLRKQGTAQQALAIATDALHRAAQDEGKRVGPAGNRVTVWNLSDTAAREEAGRLWASGDSYVAERARRACETYDAARIAVTVVKDALRPLHAEYDRRGGWTRAFVVVGTGVGHVHKDQECPSCYPTTQYGWLPQLSGLTEDEIVQAAGTDACTYCYPSAPVEKLGRRTAYSGEEMDDQHAAALREDEKRTRAAVKAAKAITNPDGTALRFDGYRIDTEVTARNTYVDRLAQDMAYTQRGYNRIDRAEDFEAILAALAHKHDTTVEEQREALAPKVLKKAKRYGYTAS